MRPQLIIPFLLALAVPAASLAQGSLCNPCVDPPLDDIRSPFQSPRDTTVIRAEDMRQLGVIDVAEMIRRGEGGGLNSLDYAATRELGIARIRLQANGRCPRTADNGAGLRIEGADGVWHGSSDFAVQLAGDGGTGARKTLIWYGPAADAAGAAALEVAVSRIDAGGGAATGDVAGTRR